MRQMSFKAIEKKLAKKNAEIEKLQNQKVEFIFAQVKKEMKNENLDVSSRSILSLLEVLRKNQQIFNPKISSDEVEDSELEISAENSSSRENINSRLSREGINEQRRNI